MQFGSGPRSVGLLESNDLHPQKLLLLYDDDTLRYFTQSGWISFAAQYAMTVRLLVSLSRVFSFISFSFRTVSAVAVAHRAYTRCPNENEIKQKMVRQTTGDRRSVVIR